jgi:hypothetical protein
MNYVKEVQRFIKNMHCKLVPISNINWFDSSKVVLSLAIINENESHGWLSMKWEHFGVTVMDSFDEEMCELSDDWIG